MLQSDQEKILVLCKEKCYISDNNFAYKKDLYDLDPTIKNFDRMFADSKLYNFVPTSVCDNLRTD